MSSSKLTDLDQFFAGFKSLHFNKGEIILRAGDPVPGVYFLKRGYVRLFTVSADGEELTLIIFKNGDIFPISWAVGGSTLANQKNYYLEALTNCELKRTSKGVFINFIKSNQEALFDLTIRLSDRLNGMLIRAESFVFGDAGSRIASILFVCAERFGRKTDLGVEIQIPLTHRDIATLIGVARETASIEIKKLEKRGIIGYRGRNLIIKNAIGLRRSI